MSRITEIPSGSPTRRIFLAGAVGAASLAGLAACSGSGRTTIRFYQTKPEVVGYFDKLIARYNASQSKVTVVHDSTSSVAAQFVRGNVPDLALQNYELQSARYIARGVLSDLADLPAAKTIRPSVQQLVNQYASYKGQTSVLPYSITACAVIYNKTLFRKAGVSVPTTFSEFLDVCKKLKAAGIPPIYSTYKDPWTLRQGAFDYSVGGYLPDTAQFFKDLEKEGTDVTSSSTTAFTKQWAEPVNRMMEFLQYSQQDADTRGYADGNLAVAQGKGAMYLQGPWALGEIALTSKTIQLGQFPLPMTEDPSDRKVRVNLDLAAWIPVNAPHPQEARDFLSWLMQPSINNKYNADNLAFGVTKTAPDPTDPRITGIASYVRKGEFYQGPQTYFPQSLPFEGLLQGAVLSGKGTPMLETTQSDWRRIAVRTSV